MSIQCDMTLEKYEDSYIVSNTVQITEETVSNDCEEDSSTQEVEVVYKWDGFASQRVYSH